MPEEDALGESRENWMSAERMEQEALKQNQGEFVTSCPSSPKRIRLDEHHRSPRATSSSPVHSEHYRLSARSSYDCATRKRAASDFEIRTHGVPVGCKRRYSKHVPYIDGGRHTEPSRIVYYDREHAYTHGLCYQQTRSATLENYTKIMFPLHLPPPLPTCNIRASSKSYNSMNHEDIPSPVLENCVSKDVEPHSPSFQSDRYTPKLLDRTPIQPQSRINFDVTQMYVPTEGDERIACSVNGLLNLPGSNEKRYEISVGELKRRIASPECLNKVDMISYVRLAKQSARELLERYGIRPKHHSRKSKHSILSKMCEAECQQLADGLQDLSGKYFPKEWLARRSVKVLSSEVDEEKVKILKRRYEEIEITRSVLFDLGTSINSSRHEKDMQAFDLVTHTYGLKTLLNHIDLISTTLEAQLRHISSLCHGN